VGDGELQLCINEVEHGLRSEQHGLHVDHTTASCVGDRSHDAGEVECSGYLQSGTQGKCGEAVHEFSLTLQDTYRV
jgi:hypothetical protein